ncbi:hypothetical protein SAMN04488505_1011314 [Chitinophaga rupis]|uniref:N,N-dimethylformamidase beta subunit-like C-terminal domain-containing protein n=1 Tax=Chitinophaga rupis TaxID=573321 RepID=A0A1H7LS31_9BACT|nr:N,N-dimethylformamidase beta subunit family domain-containing protein [Chitinophaga rupis]SEL01275.1 hypothetical protein SAMN04488505_1011314 [Chitinophaga rupis]
MKRRHRLPVLSFTLIFMFFIYSCSKKDGVAKGDIYNDKSIVNGYVDKQSYLPGDSAKLYVSANRTYQDTMLFVYDMYGRVRFTIKFNKIFTQDPQGETPYEDGFHYTDPVAFKIPADIKSGVYLIANQVPVIVKSPAKEIADFTIVYPLNTENAYCETGRRSLYTVPVAKKVSFLRPIPFSVYAEGFLKWVIKQNYSYNVISDMDLDDYNNFKGKVVIIIGHSEYWSRKARRNFDRFVAEGKNALVLSGNTMWWQVRYSDDGTQLICYKGSGEPPVPDSLKTVLWAGNYLKYPIVQSIGCDFDRGGYGVPVKNEGWNGFKIVQPNSPLLSGLNMKKGDVISCPSNEYDGAPVKGFDAEGTPIIDNNELKFNKVELVGYDFGFRSVKTVATAIVFKKTVSSGTIVNIPSTNWCTAASFGKEHVVKVTKNAIDGLVKGNDMFTK